MSEEVIYVSQHTIRGVVKQVFSREKSGSVTLQVVKQVQTGETQRTLVHNWVIQVWDMPMWQYLAQNGIRPGLVLTVVGELDYSKMGEGKDRLTVTAVRNQAAGHMVQLHPEMGLRFLYEYAEGGGINQLHPDTVWETQKVAAAQNNNAGTGAQAGPYVPPGATPAPAPVAAPPPVAVAPAPVAAPPPVAVAPAPVAAPPPVAQYAPQVAPQPEAAPAPAAYAPALQPLPVAAAPVAAPAGADVVPPAAPAATAGATDLPLPAGLL